MESPYKREEIHTMKNTMKKITVKKYMTQTATPAFNFMEQWNGNKPMPLRTMAGEVIKETRGMVYMKLHGDIFSEQTTTCMCCGKEITNEVSRYFGMGPKCGGHNYVNPFDTAEELHKAVADYQQKLRGITWEGWVIKSAILEDEEVNEFITDEDRANKRLEEIGKEIADLKARIRDLEAEEEEILSRR